MHSWSIIWDWDAKSQIVNIQINPNTKLVVDKCDLLNDPSQYQRPGWKAQLFAVTRPDKPAVSVENLFLDSLNTSFFLGYSRLYFGIS